MSGGQRAFQLLDLHITSGFTQYSISNLSKLLHVIFELLLSHVPRHIPHEQGGVGCCVSRFFFTWGSLHFLFLLGGWRVCLCSLLFFKLDRLWFNGLLLGQICVFENMLHFCLVTCLRNTEFNCQAAPLKHGRIHGSDSGLSLSFTAELNKSKSSVLVVCVVEWHVNRIDFTEFAECFLQMLLAHIEH